MQEAVTAVKPATHESTIGAPGSPVHGSLASTELRSGPRPWGGRCTVSGVWTVPLSGTGLPNSARTLSEQRRQPSESGQVGSPATRESWARAQRACPPAGRREEVTAERIAEPRLSVPFTPPRLPSPSGGPGSSGLDVGIPVWPLGRKTLCSPQAPWETDSHAGGEGKWAGRGGCRFTPPSSHRLTPALFSLPPRRADPGRRASEATER